MKKLLLLIALLLPALRFGLGRDYRSQRDIAVRLKRRASGVVRIAIRIDLFDREGGFFNGDF